MTDDSEKFVAAIEDLFEEIMGLNKDRICNCGTKSDAFDIAERLILESIRNDCPAWMLQVATAHALLGRALFKKIHSDCSADEQKRLLKYISEEMFGELKVRVPKMLAALEKQSEGG